MTKKILTAIIILLFAAAAALAQEEKRFSVPLGDSPSRGPQDARITLIEFIDFQ